MHCLAGLDTLSGGQVYIGATDLSSLSERDLTLLRRDKVGFVFQAFNLVPTLSALENITLPMDLAGNDPDEAWLDHVINTVGLADRMSHLPSELSGGQQQRVAVSRALASRPEIIFADEPTGNLDSTSGNEILQFMRDAVDNLGQTIVMVTHDPLAAAFRGPSHLPSRRQGRRRTSRPDRRAGSRPDEAVALMIFKLIRRNISGKPFRFLLTCSAVTLGVMFTVGVFVFTDGLRATFGSIAEDIDGDTEYAVRSEVDFGDREHRQRSPRRRCRRSAQQHRWRRRSTTADIQVRVCPDRRRR